MDNNDELLAEIGRRRADPEFQARLDRILTEEADVLNRLEPHLGCVICRSSVDSETGRCAGPCGVDNP